MAQPVSPVPPATKPIGPDGLFVTSWAQMLSNWYFSLRAPASPAAPPPNSASPGIAGQLAFDQNFLYVCVRQNTATVKALWKRIALVNF